MPQLAVTETAEASFYKSIFVTLLLNFTAYLILITILPFISEEIILILCALPLLILIIFNFNFVYSLLVATLFYHLYYKFNLSVWFSVIFFISFIITHKKISLEEVKSPITKGFMVYLIAIIPSFINAVRPVSSLILIYHLVALFLVFNITQIYFTNEKQFKYFLWGYLGLVLLNTIFLIYEAIISNKRAYGFTGIMYVDFVGIAIIISSIKLYFNEGYKKLIWGLLFLLFLFGLILTQTRSSWLVTATTLLLFGFYIIYNSKKLKINKAKIIFGVIVILAFVLVIAAFTIELNPKIAERAVEYSSNVQALDKRGYAINSLVSRMFIWMTAWDAFMAHPFIGIGFSAFPYSSILYNQLPKYLFNEYVSGLTAHLTILAVAVETGIVGLIGFGYFLFTIMKENIKILSLKNSEKININGIIIGWCIIYIFISMLVTDAWLWGQGIILFGIFIGMLLAVKKLSLDKK